VRVVRSDAELLREASSNADAYIEVYDRHAATILRRLRSRGLGSADAADLLAETFAEAWLHRRRFRDPGDGSALPWLLGIANNLARQLWRKAGVEEKARLKLRMPVGRDEAQDATVRIDAEACARSLERALLRLPASRREVVRLRVVEQLDYPEIAARLNCSEQTARKRLSLALRSLREDPEVASG